MIRNKQPASAAGRTAETAPPAKHRRPRVRSALGVRLSAVFLLAAGAPLAAAVVMELTGVEDRLHLKAAAVAVAVALALGWRQSRLLAQPLQRLLRATQRLIGHDFSAHIPARGSDELAQLGRAFNEMTHSLGMNFATLHLLSEIDQTILAKAEITDVAKSTLRCLRNITSARVAMLGLYDDESADSMRIYALRHEGRLKTRTDLALTPELKARISHSCAAAWQAQAPLADAMMAQLREQDRVHTYWVQPIDRGDRAWGVLMLGHDEALALTPNQLTLLARVEERLEVAFSTLERDRKLRTMAHTDALTGLPNRAAMRTLLAHEVACAEREHTTLGVLFLDLDRFKRANDTLGHAAGDALLRMAADRIRGALRTGDVVARPGGDEFTVLLGKLASARDAGLVARQLIKALSRPFEVDGHTVYVGASVGIALYPQDGLDGPDLLKKADSAMYRAKETGRNRFAYYEESMNVEALRRAALDRELHLAFERNELRLHFQPQIDVRTGRVCAAEALVRWQHPEQGLLLPPAFIPFAEENGLIDAIGSWVMREACLQFQRWQREGVPIPRIAVNVSHRQLLRSNFLRTVHYLLNLAVMAPGSLEIEVTESMFVEAGKAGIEALKLLGAAGVRIAIDDFGTGYSSFGYLKTLPVSILKLDKSFLDDAPENADAATIVTAIVNMARTLRKEVVAEGVERPEQFHFLRRLDCEKVQGYLFSPAVDAAAVARLARARMMKTEDLCVAESA